MKTTSTKAVVGALVAGVSAFIAPIGVTLHAGLPITPTTWFDCVVAGLGVAALVFPSVWGTTNRPVEDDNQPW